MNEIAVGCDEDAGGRSADPEQLLSSLRRSERDARRALPEMKCISFAVARQPRFVLFILDDENVPHQDAASAELAGTAHATLYSRASLSTSSATLGTS